MRVVISSASRQAMLAMLCPDSQAPLQSVVAAPAGEGSVVSTVSVCSWVAAAV
ncbi:hypothetical protein ACQ86L_0030 (plasmid) [Leifsonia sp. P73]